LVNFVTNENPEETLNVSLVWHATHFVYYLAHCKLKFPYLDTFRTIKSFFRYVVGEPHSVWSVPAQYMPYVCLVHHLNIAPPKCSAHMKLHLNGVF